MASWGQFHRLSGLGRLGRLQCIGELVELGVNLDRLS